MDPWQETIENSLAISKANEILNLLKKIENQDDITNEEQDYLDRAKLVAETTLNALNNADARLVRARSLDGIGGGLSDTASHLNTWLGNRDINLLKTSSESSLDTTVAHLSVFTPHIEVEGAKQAITSLRKSVARHRQVVDDLTGKISKGETDALSLVESKSNEVNQQFSKLQQDLADLVADLDATKNTLNQVSSEQQTAFTKAEADRSTDFNSMVKSKQQELDTKLQELQEESTKEVAALKNVIDKYRQDSETAKNRVEEILGIVGDEALIGDYSLNAKAELKAANIWRWIAVAAIIVAIGFAAWFTKTIDGSTAWQKVVAKSLIVTSFAGLSAYAAKQSSEHRIAQRNAERMALQLKAIKPYLGDISSETERDGLMVKIAGRLFGRVQDSGSAKNKKEIDENPLLANQILDKVLELAKFIKS